MMNYISILPLLFSFTLSSTGFGAGESEVQKKVQAIIDQRHPVDTEQDWLGLGSGAPTVIIQMIGENTRNTFKKARLLRGLSWFKDDPSAMEFLRNEANTTEKSALRCEVIEALGRSAGDREFSFLVGFLSHEDPQTRESAAQTIQSFWISHPENSRAREMEAALEQFRAKEKSKWIVDKLDRSRAKSLGEKVANPPLKSKKLKALLDKEYDGRWKGFWIEFKEGSTDLVSNSANLQLKWKNDSELEAQIEVTSGKESTLWELVQLNGLGDRLEGTLKRVKGRVIAQESQQIPFDLKLRTHQKKKFIRIEVPALGVVGAVGKTL